MHCMYPFLRDGHPWGANAETCMQDTIIAWTFSSLNIDKYKGQWFEGFPLVSLEV